MARCTKEEAQETRSRIIDAAINVFHERGVSRTSLADVAQAANVTRGAIYWHFKNKGDLFDAMFERVTLPMEAMLQASRGESSADPLGQLRASCIFVLKDVATNPEARKVFDILFHKSEFSDPTDPIKLRQQECYLQGMADIKGTLANAVTKGQLAVDLDIELAAVSLQGTLGGLMANWLFSPQSFDLAGNAEKFIDASIDMLRYAPSLRKTAAGGA